MKTSIKIILASIFIFTGFSTLYAQNEGGGTTGADFLIAPSLVTIDGKAGVVSGLDDYLESAAYNPSLLASINEFNLYLSMAPMPNEVSDTNIGFAFPLGPGVLGINGQLFNVGTFTEINNSGQPLNTYTIFDAAFSGSYAYAINDLISVGGTLKGIYRGLGDYWAISGAADLGASLRFETPHIGQRPKAETVQDLENRLNREISDLDKQKEVRLEEAEKAFASAEESFNKANENLAALQAKLTPDMDPEKKTSVEQDIADQKKLTEEMKTSLEEAERTLDTEKADADIWYGKELAKINKAHTERIATLDHISAERNRLFSIIEDPEIGLTNEIIDSNINNLIQRLIEFQMEQQSALRAAAEEYVDRRNSQISKADDDISHYNALIDEEVGESRNKLLGQRGDLEQKVSELNTKESNAQKELENAQAAAADAKAVLTEAEKVLKALGEEGPGSSEEKAVEKARQETDKALMAVEAAKEQLDNIRKENQEPLNNLKADISVVQKQLDDLEKDVWIKRLVDRIRVVEEEISFMNKEIEDKRNEIEETSAKIDNDISSEIESLKKLGDILKKDLKRSGLEKELALLDAGNEKRISKAENDYYLQVKDIYTNLLDAMYELEERIFQSRLDAVKENAALKLFDLDKDSEKELEKLKDDYIFSRRFMVQKLNGIDKSDEENRKKAEAEFVDFEDQYNKNVEKAKKDAEDKIELINLEKKEALTKINEERRITRLIYLQTDTPYKNTSVTLSIRNAGIPITFAETSSPLPISIYTSLGYSLINLDRHRLSISTMFEYSFFEPITFGFGGDYIFNDLIYVRVGYLFGKDGQSFSAGFGLNTRLGTSQYKADYAFKPVSGYGYIHSFGINAQF